MLGFKCLYIAIECFLIFHFRIEIDNGRSTLFIEDAKKPDAAWYQCSAVNVAGTASTRAKLVVQRKYIYCNVQWWIRHRHRNFIFRRIVNNM